MREKIMVVQVRELDQVKDIYASEEGEQVVEAEAVGFCKDV